MKTLVLIIVMAIAAIGLTLGTLLIFAQNKIKSLKNAKTNLREENANLREEISKQSDQLRLKGIEIDDLKKELDKYSETYIEMCDCPEIQLEWEIESPDWYFDRKFSGTVKYLESGQINDTYVEFLTKHCIWLPRQDQIQEMCKKRQNLYYLLKDIQVFQVKYTSCEIATMEQLWLAFYMYEKHKKVWDGKEWIEEVLGN